MRSEALVMKRVIGYARESTREQAAYGFNLDDQERWIREYVSLYYKRDDIQFSMIREEGASARSLNRPQMNELIKMMEEDAVDVLIVHNLDRLTRQLTDLHELLGLFRKHNVQLISLKEKVDTETVQGKFFISIIVLIAQWEEETISDRSIRGMMESARQGNYSWGKIPFGYYRDPIHKGKLLIDKEKAAIVKRIFTDIATGKHTYFTMAALLRKEEAGGRRWVERRVEEIIKNKIYYGTLQLRNEEIENHQPAIIGKDLWDQANEAVTKNDIRSYTYIFKGKVSCKDCRCVCEHTSTTKSSGKTYLYYRCPVCKTYFNEQKIITAIESELDEMIKNHHLYYEARVLMRRVNEAKQHSKLLLIDHTYYRFNANYVDEIMKIHKEEILEAESELSCILPKIEKMSFLSTDQEERLLLLGKYVDLIYVHPILPEIEVSYTEEYEVIKNHGC